MARKKSPNLTEGELRLMNVVWKEGRATVGDVVASLPANPPLAYSTVLTTLRILEAKGYLRHTKKGRAFIYEPVIAHEEASRTALGHLVNRFFGGFPKKTQGRVFGRAAAAGVNDQRVGYLQKLA